MILDGENLFYNAHSITTAAAANSDIIDTQQPAFYDVGKGQPLNFFAQTTPDTAAVAGALTVAIETDSDPAFGTAVVIATGYIRSPNGGGQCSLQAIPQDCKRYIRLAPSGGGAATAGTLSAGLCVDHQTNV